MEKITYTPLAIELDFVVIIDCLSDDERTKHKITSQLVQDLKAKEIGCVTCPCKDKATAIKFSMQLSTKAKEGRKFCINSLLMAMKIVLDSNRVEKALNGMNCHHFWEI